MPFDSAVAPRFHTKFMLRLWLTFTKCSMCHSRAFGPMEKAKYKPAYVGHDGGCPVSTQCRSRPLSLPFAHGPSALWKKSNINLLMCEHNADLCLTFSALLWAFVDIIPHFLRFSYDYVKDFCFLSVLLIYWFSGIPYLSY